MSPRRSYAIWLPLQSGIDVAQQPARLRHRMHGNQLNAIVVLNHLHRLPRLNAKRLADRERNNDLKIGRYQHGVHVIDLSRLSVIGDSVAFIIPMAPSSRSARPQPFGITLRPRTVSNSLTAGTSIAITVKP